MHDLADLEARGIPSVGVVTDAFIDAAAGQSASLGFEPALVLVPHPVQNLRDAEIHALAEAIVAVIVERLRA